MHGELENGLCLSLLSLFYFFFLLFFFIFFFLLLFSAADPVEAWTITSRYASRATSGRAAKLLANLHLNGTTYLPVACGPRHNSSPLLATVHAKEKNDASENSCAERSDRTRQAVYAKSDVSTADDPLDPSRSRDIVSRMSGSDAGYAENRRSRAGRTHSAKVDAWLKIGLAEIIDRRRSIQSRLIVDLFWIVRICGIRWSSRFLWSDDRFSKIINFVYWLS